MNIPRLMAFIDGENIVARYQGLIQAGRKVGGAVGHLQDEFVWCSSLALPTYFDPIRAYYYASVVGDDIKVRSLEDHIRNQSVGLSEHHASSRVLLYPRVYKKPSRSNKTTTVDIQLAVDVLTHVYQHDIEAVLLVTGDADFVSLARAIVSRGKKLFVAAFSEGLAPDLVPIADRFIELDDSFFSRP
jgi:uncharacterized LabA/DUF88 family protein